MRVISTEEIHKELDMIQACITRMAQNSFLVKGWFISLVTVSIALKVSNPWVYSALLFALGICFYFVNLQFYVYEKQFRELYAERVNLRVEYQLRRDLYSIKVDGFKWDAIKRYGPENKMLMLIYFMLPLIFSIINCFMNQSTDADKIIIEIQGIKNLLK